MELFLQSLPRVAFRLPLRRATWWRGRTGRSQYTSYNRLSTSPSKKSNGPGLTLHGPAFGCLPNQNQNQTYRTWGNIYKCKVIIPETCTWDSIYM
jgi:hypothetical protein